MKKCLTLILLCLSLLSCDNQANQDYELLLSKIQTLDKNSNMKKVENVLMSIAQFKQTYPKHKKLFELSQREQELVELIPYIIYHSLTKEVSKINENSNIEAIDDIIKKISEFLNEYNTVDDFISLKGELNRVEKLRDIVVYNHIIKLTTEIANKKDYSSYDEKISAYVNLIELYNSNSTLQIDSIRLSKFSNYLNWCLAEKSNIENEYNKYIDLKYNPTVALVNDFLEQYPHSIMRDELVGMLDDLLLTEFLTTASHTFTSIDDINSAMNDAKSCIKKLSKNEYKLQIQEYITNIEAQRRNVLELELSDKLQYLISEMGDAARAKAKRAHTTYNVTTCSPRGSQPEVFGYSSTFERVYQVNMKGAFLGWDKRELTIVVTGKISGNVNYGVSYSVTGTRIDSDRKF